MNTKRFVFIAEMAGARLNIRPIADNKAVGRGGMIKA